MRRLPITTRARAALLRTFRGRPRGQAAWDDAPPEPSAGPPFAATVAGMEVAAAPVGPRRTGTGTVAMVYEVTLQGPAGQRWTRRYGLAPGAPAAGAIEAALDELNEAHVAPSAWLARCTEGMSEDEAEAILDSPALDDDRAAATWVGPLLAPEAEARATRGGWLPTLSDA